MNERGFLAMGDLDRDLGDLDPDDRDPDASESAC